MTKKTGFGKVDPDKAIIDPASVFSSPVEVIDRVDLSRDLKIEILRRWEYDAREESTAAEEGMGEFNGELLQQIECALRRLVDDFDLDHTPPTKQSGLQRKDLKR